MARSRAKVFLFGAIACLYASVCLSEDQLKEETVFSVGHSSDKNSHSRASFLTRFPNLVGINTGKSNEDPVIHMFGEGDDSEKIDLLLPGQELNGEHGSSFWAGTPHSKQYTPAQPPSSTSPSLAPPSPVPNSPPPVAPTAFPSGESPSPLPPSASISPTPPVAPSIFPPFSYSPSPTSFPPSTAPSSTPYPFPPSPTSPPIPIFPPSVSPPSNPPSVLPPVLPPFPSVTPPTFPPSASPSPYVQPPIFPPSSSSSPSLPPSIFPSQPPSQTPSPSPSHSPSPSPSLAPSSVPTSLSPSPTPTPSVTPPQPLPLPPTPSPSSPAPSSPLPAPIPSPVPTPWKISVLKNLIVPNGASLEPDFNPFVFNYKVSFGSNVRRFVVVAYLPEDDEDYKNLSLLIGSVPLQSGEKSPPLKLGKRGETVTFHIYVKAVNHAPTTYVLSVTREAGHKGLGTIAVIFVVLACIVGTLILMLLGCAAYFYARTGRMLQLRDFQILRGRDGTLYNPLIASGVTNDDSRL